MGLKLGPALKLCYYIEKLKEIKYNWKCENLDNSQVYLKCFTLKVISFSSVCILWKVFIKIFYQNCSTITLIVCSYSLNDTEYVLLAYL